jgi:hypothetical protein
MTNWGDVYSYFRRERAGGLPRLFGPRLA